MESYNEEQNRENMNMMVMFEQSGLLTQGGTDFFISETAGGDIWVCVAIGLKPMTTQPKKGL